MKRPEKKIGLIGSITHDVITFPSGAKDSGLGGVLYPASVLCGLEKEICLTANLAEELASPVNALLKDWPTIDIEGVRTVPGRGNQVNLFYQNEGERQEILESVVPPLEPERVISRLSDMGFLILLMISGMDITLEDWNRIKEKARCPVWMDIHSLALSPELGKVRRYIPLPDWPEWAKGVDYLQANRKEAACMMGCPDKNPDENEIAVFGESVLKRGVRAFIVTLGEEGILILTSEGARKMKPDESAEVKDTTGCGDVFCAAASSRLGEGKDIWEAVRFGLKLASTAVGKAGIRETFKMTQELKVQ
jgi:sugar/nucleoside kinase (ribokinase family)